MSAAPKRIQESPVVVTEGPVTEVVEPQPVLSEDQVRSQLASEYELRMAVLEAKLNAALESRASAEPAPKRNNYDFGVNPFDNAAEAGDTLVHFLEDGFTVGSLVYYRGQEAMLSSAQANLSSRDQILAYGRIMYRLGAWDGDVYDVNDPALSEKDREVLTRINTRLLNR